VFQALGFEQREFARLALASYSETKRPNLLAGLEQVRRAQKRSNNLRAVDIGHTQAPFARAHAR